MMIGSDLRNLMMESEAMRAVMGWLNEHNIGLKHRIYGEVDEWLLCRYLRNSYPEWDESYPTLTQAIAAALKVAEEHIRMGGAS